MLQSPYIITHHNTGMQGSEIILLLKIVQIILLSSPPGQIRPARVRPAPLARAQPVRFSATRRAYFKAAHASTNIHGGLNCPSTIKTAGYAYMLTQIPTANRHARSKRRATPHMLPRISTANRHARSKRRATPHMLTRISTANRHARSCARPPPCMSAASVAATASGASVGISASNRSSSLSIP